MKRFACFALLSLLPAWVGCGGTKPAENAQSSDGKAVASSAPAAKTANAPSPSEVVNLFLDSLKKGDEVTTASLFTDRAREEVKKHDMMVAPSGNPDAKYRVGETRYADDAKDAALVECEWSEPLPDGTTSTTQVVWEVCLERQGWRISGMMIYLEPPQTPIVIDFEDMSTLMSQGTPNGNATPANNTAVAGGAAAPGGTSAAAAQPSLGLPAGGAPNSMASGVPNNTAPNMVQPNNGFAAPSGATANGFAAPAGANTGGYANNNGFAAPSGATNNGFAAPAGTNTNGFAAPAGANYPNANTGTNTAGLNAPANFAPANGGTTGSSQIAMPPAGQVPANQMRR